MDVPHHGLRTVALDTTRDAEGSRFLFLVNGTPAFARGANVVPPDHFPAAERLRVRWLGGR